jgi:steroid delta-isomerase
MTVTKLLGLAMAAVLFAGQAAGEGGKPSAEAVKKTMEAYIAAYNAHDMAAVIALYDDNATVEDPAGSPPHKGVQAIRQFYESVIGHGGRLEPVSINPAADGTGAMFFQVRINTTTINVIEFMSFSDAGKITGMKAYSAFVPQP